MTKSRTAIHRKSASLNPADVRRLLLQVLPQRPGQPKTEAFKQKLKVEYERDGQRADIFSTTDIRIVAESLIAHLQSSGLDNSSGNSKSTKYAISKTQAAETKVPTQEHTRAKARMPKETWGSRESYRSEHPAIIANRLIRLPGETQDQEQLKLSGGLARQVKFIIHEASSRVCR